MRYAPPRKAVPESMKLLRQHASDQAQPMLQALIDLATKSTSDAVRMRAAIAVLEVARQAEASDGGMSLIEFFSQIPIEEPPAGG